MRRLIATLTLAAAPAFAAGQNVLSNTDHVVGTVQAALTALGVTGVIIDQTCGSGTGSPVCGATGSFVTPGAPFVAYALDAGPFYSAGTTTVVNDQPYPVLTESSTNYSVLLDQQIYNTLIANGIVYSMPHCSNSSGSPDYPPVTMVNVLPAGAGAGPGCGYDAGTEFSLSVNYLFSGSTASPSASGATMAGILVAMKANHPTWSWFDVKGALRQTASNWPTGQVPNNAGALGYGNVNYTNAVALSSTASIYLQAPGMSIVNNRYYASITLYPFASARRTKEVVYVGGTWPAPSTLNEMTAAQITAAGGTKVIDDGGTTGAQTFTYAPAASGSATFTAITLDSSGNGSRVESFSQVPETFVVGTACLQ